MSFHSLLSPNSTRKWLSREWLSGKTRLFIASLRRGWKAAAKQLEAALNLLLHRHSYISILISSRFISSINKKQSFFAACRSQLAALLSKPSSNLMSATSSQRLQQCVNFNIDGSSIASRRTHPSHSKPSPLILFPLLRYPLPQFHQVCARFLDPPVLDFSIP